MCHEYQKQNRLNSVFTQLTTNCENVRVGNNARDLVREWAPPTAGLSHAQTPLVKHMKAGRILHDSFSVVNIALR